MTTIFNVCHTHLKQSMAQMVVQVSGSGVTPFLIPQQTTLLRATASVLTTVSLADLQIRYVSSSVNQRRRLLDDDAFFTVRIYNSKEGLPIQDIVLRQPSELGD